MSPKRKQRYLYIDGKAIPVTEKVYRAFWHYEDKEDYFMRLLKSPRQIRDKDTQEVIVVPAREIPMEQIPAWLQSSTTARSDVEDLVLSGIWLEQVLNTLTEEERRIVQEFYINGKNEREACAALGPSQNDFSPPGAATARKTGDFAEKFSLKIRLKVDQKAFAITLLVRG